jgi:hypothetical protein
MVGLNLFTNKQEAASPAKEAKARLKVATMPNALGSYDSAVLLREPHLRVISDEYSDKTEDAIRRLADKGKDARRDTAVSAALKDLDEKWSRLFFAYAKVDGVSPEHKSRSLVDQVTTLINDLQENQEMLGRLGIRVSNTDIDIAGRLETMKGAVREYVVTEEAKEGFVELAGNLRDIVPALEELSRPRGIPEPTAQDADQLSEPARCYAALMAGVLKEMSTDLEKVGAPEKVRSSRTI